MFLRHLRITAYRLWFVLALSLLVTSCASFHKKGDLPIVDKDVKAIYAIVTAKEDAIRRGDMQRYLDLLDKTNTAYVVEQQHWLQYFVGADVHDFRLEIEDIAKREDNTYVAIITQQYKYGPKRVVRKCRFNQKFIYSAKGWKDADMEFRERETDHFILKAVDAVSEQKINKIADDAEEAWQIVREAYGVVPPDKTEIKVYNDPALVREITKVSADRVMYGWYEYPESIKLVVKKKRRYSYIRTIAHELMHKTSLSQARNQCPWFAEGLAVYFGTFQALGGTYSDKG